MRFFAISLSLACLATLGCSSPNATHAAPSPAKEPEPLRALGYVDDDPRAEPAEELGALGYLGSAEEAAAEPAPAADEVAAAEPDRITAGPEEMASAGLPVVESDTPVVPATVVPRSQPGNMQDTPKATDGFDHTHALWTEVLKAHVKGDRFDYEALKRDPQKLRRYLDRLHAVTPAELASWTREQRYAFWINVYNAHTVDLIVGEYPLDSIRDLGGLFSKVWDKEFIEMRAHHPDGKDDELSLDDVEHAILRPRFEDARIHAAVNCASIGCPPLRNEAFVAERLDAQLDEQMRAFLADESRNRFDRAGNRVRISKIFDWFAGDFERDAESVRAYLRRYHPGDDDAWIQDAKVDYLDYDWDLNDVPKEKR